MVNRAPKATEYVSLNELPKTIQKAYAKESLRECTKDEKGSFNKELKLQEQRNRYGAESQITEETKETQQQQLQQQQNMYAEINELRTEIAASAATTNNSISTLTYLQNTPPSSANSSPHVSPHKGARIRLNAQGKPIYDSDSLKRRKGAHTTFAPGPYVKRNLDKEIENESIDTTTTIRNTATTSESNQINPIARLLLLNRANNAANPRKIANVRPIINKTHIQRPLPSTPIEPQRQQTNTANEMSGFYMTSHYAVYNKDASNKHQTSSNGLNPYFHQQSAMHSPSTKSIASSTGSIISSSTTASSSAQSASSASSTTTTTTTQSGGSSAKDDEGYQHLYKTPDELDSYYETLTQKPLEHNVAFQRNTPVYWTLQNRRPVKPQPQVSAVSRDDLYATPLKRSERLARNQQQQLSEQQKQQHLQQHIQQKQHLYSVVNKASSASSLNTTANLSPVVQHNRATFRCSTPIRGPQHPNDSQLPPDNIPAKQRIRNWDDNSPERLNTCADRIGQSKTSLMDFKKLLLAKSAKSSTVPKKISAVELLKKSNTNLQTPLRTNTCSSSSSLSVNSSNSYQLNPGASASTSTVSQLNSSLKLLDLSGSPKTFANRRMLRQGQFGSPSKTFVPKLKSSPSNWRSNSVQRTDIMSTTIPEANSEEDQSGNSLTKTSNFEKATSHESLVDTDSLNLKRNIFLQTEENNFMRGELRSSFTRSKADTANTNKYVTGPLSPLRLTSQFTSTIPVVSSVNAASLTNTAASTSVAAAAAVATAANTTTASITTMPALETAL